MFAGLIECASESTRFDEARCLGGSFEDFGRAPRVLFIVYAMRSLQVSLEDLSAGDQNRVSEKPGRRYRGNPVRILGMRAI